jgi:hypothetical protein
MVALSVRSHPSHRGVAACGRALVIRDRTGAPEQPLSTDR